MKCSEVMKKQVECCELVDTAADVAEQMRRRNIGFLPVCDPAGNAVGTITDRDLAMRVVAERRDVESTLVEEVMSTGVVSCLATDDLQTAEALMSEHKKSRIICVSSDRKPLGVISLSDIAEVEDQDRTARLVRAVSERGANV